jgi:hypothetical protein
MTYSCVLPCCQPVQVGIHAARARIHTFQSRDSSTATSRVSSSIITATSGCLHKRRDDWLVRAGKCARRRCQRTVCNCCCTSATYNHSASWPDTVSSNATAELPYASHQNPSCRSPLLKGTWIGAWYSHALLLRDVNCSSSCMFFLVALLCHGSIVTGKKTSITSVA